MLCFLQYVSTRKPSLDEHDDGLSVVFPEIDLASDYAGAQDKVSFFTILLCIDVNMLCLLILIGCVAVVIKQCCFVFCYSWQK